MLLIKKNEIGTTAIIKFIIDVNGCWSREFNGLLKRLEFSSFEKKFVNLGWICWKILNLKFPILISIKKTQFIHQNQHSIPHQNVNMYGQKFNMHKLIQDKIFTEMETNEIYYSHIQSTWNYNKNKWHTLDTKL